MIDDSSAPLTRFCLSVSSQDDLPLSEAVPLLIKVLAKSMDTSLAVDKVEISTLSRDASGKVRPTSLTLLLACCGSDCPFVQGHFTKSLTVKYRSVFMMGSAREKKAMFQMWRMRTSTLYSP